MCFPLWKNLGSLSELNMSMTYEQFAKYASGFKNHSDSIDDGWIINELHNAMDGIMIKYLTKKEMRTFNESSLSFDDSEFFKENDYSPVICEYHILYNPSYLCPDMFFNMWSTDGKLLSLEHIWSLVHCCFKQNITRDKWNAITQQEHPYNGAPFFRVHPCKNTHILKVLGLTSKNISEYNPLITWLSTISPFIGLEMHISYGQIISDDVLK